MRIWLLQIGEPLPLNESVRKLRTALMADMFLEAGHEVLWWASAYEHQRKALLFDNDAEVKLKDNYSIILLKGMPYRRNLSMRRYVDHYFIARKFKKAAAHYPPPDVIVASMPSYDLAYEAVEYAKARNIPVVVDVRDLWPDTFLDYFGRLTRSVASIVLRRDFRKLKYLLKNASAISAMSEGVLSWAMAHAGRNRSEKDRVFYLGYSPIYKLNRSGIREDVMSLFNNLASKRLCVFIGTHGRSYELDLVLDVADRIQKDRQQSHLHFVIAGQGENSDRLLDRAKGILNVTFAGWLNADEIAALMDQAYLGIVPCKSVVDAYPNKPIEYMSAGLPVVSSVEGELAMLIDKENVGLNYKAGDVDGLFSCVIALAENDELRNRMSSNARRVFAEKFDAKKIYHEYVEYVESLVNNHLKPNR